ncbi:MAG: response regulator [Anaerolineae bacterium]|nr:response regulator [Anaerolineae bacterium]
MDTVNSPNLRILVVDDHPSTATTLARAISQISPHLDVISARSGENALTLVQDKPVDFLITDMMMTGMNGLELIEKLQSHPAGRPSYIMLVTAYDIPGLKITARRLRVNEIIIKPVRPERVCQLVVKAMEDLGSEAPSQGPETKSVLKILIADDLPDNVSLLVRYLTNEGYACISACNGEEALAKARTELPDLVLLDMNMPIKDGFQTLQEIRSDPAIGHIPVIILTAARLEAMDMQSALNMGADDYVTKPFDRRELLARIRTRLRVKEAEDVIRRRNKELNLLPEIGRELSARPDVNELTDIILRRTVETLGAFLGHLILLEPQGIVHKKHRVSSENDFVSELPDLTPLLAQVKNTRQGFVIGDVRKDARWPVVEGDSSRSVVVVPMFGRFGLLGLLVLVHEYPDYFSFEHMLLLQAIASQAAIAMENANLFTEMAQDRKRLNAVLQCAVDATLVLDNDKKLVLFNTAAEQLFANYEIKLGKLLVLEPGCDSLEQLLGKADDIKTQQTGEIVWPDKRTFITIITPMDDGYVIVLRNIS